MRIQGWCSFRAGLFFLRAWAVLGCFCVFYAIHLVYLCADGRRVCSGVCFSFPCPRPRISRPRLGNEIDNWYIRVGSRGWGAIGGGFSRALADPLISRAPLGRNPEWISWEGFDDFRIPKSRWLRDGSANQRIGFFTMTSRLSGFVVFVLPPPWRPGPVLGARDVPAGELLPPSLAPDGTLARDPGCANTRHWELDTVPWGSAISLSLVVKRRWG